MSLRPLDKKIISLGVFFVLVVAGGRFYWAGRTEKATTKTNDNTTLFLSRFLPTASGDTAKPITISLAPLPAAKPTAQTISHLLKPIPVLMYHYIRDYNHPTDKIGSDLSVSPTNLERQLQEIKNNGYTAITFNDIIANQNIPEKPLILTFDDGYRDAYTAAFPLLKKYQTKAVFFLITQEIDYNDYYLTSGQIAEMKSAGMEFGSHSLSHPDLTKISDERLDREIKNSKNDFQAFCYPSGRNDERVVNKVREAGYVFAVTTRRGIAMPEDDLLALPRIRVNNATKINF